MRLHLSLSCALLVALSTSAARAERVIDMTFAGATFVDEQGVRFQQSDQRPTGTGYIKPFLRIQRTGTEHGYNTDRRPTQFDEKQDPWTHSLLKSSLSGLNIGGTVYLQFLLDVNEPGTDSGRLLSMNKLQFFLTNRPGIFNYDAPSRVRGTATDNFYDSSNGALARKIYDLDGMGGGDDRRVELDYRLNSGSGSGDLFVYVPQSYFSGPEQYIVLYSSFGCPNGSAAGFEEWAAVVPLPTSALGGLGLFGGLASFRYLHLRRRGRQLVA